MFIKASKYKIPQNKHRKRGERPLKVNSQSLKKEIQENYRRSPMLMDW
jgi:hypothetical protein